MIKLSCKIFTVRIVSVRTVLFLIPLTFLIVFSSLTASAASDAEKILSLVDYIGGDYQNAVSEGNVINESEYGEMCEFSAEAVVLTGRITNGGSDIAGIEPDVNKLSALIADKAGAERVKELAGIIKNKIIESYDITPYPESRPVMDNGRQLFAGSCAQCHGPHGAGDGALASGLSPRPTNLTDPDFYAGLSPFKVFNTITFGIDGTAMPSFPALSDTEKWDIAFYVLGLGANRDDASTGREIVAELPAETTDYKTLATFTNNDLSAALDNYHINDNEKEAAISYLRSAASASSESRGEAPLLITGRLLDESLELYGEGNREGAYEKALDAYLLGFEQVEPELLVKDKKLTSEIESGFSGLRNAIKSNKPADEVSLLGGTIRDNLDSASALLGGGEPIDTYVSFLNSFAIMVREGLEAILIIAAIIAFLNATGAWKAVRYIHLGWILALGAGILTWVLARTIISISGAQREVIEGVTSLLAAVVLFYVSYWLITKIEVRKWKEYIQGKVERAVTKKSIIALAGVSFFAVYREAFETVLFYQALWFQSEQSKSAVLWGIVAGFAVLVVLFFVVFKMALRIPIKYFFSVTSIFLYFLSFILIGKGIKELQASGIIGVTPIDFLPTVDVLGLYPTLETIVPQLLLIAAFAFGVYWLDFVKRESEKKEIAVSVSRIAEDVKSMYAAFDHIKGHIIEWRRCEDIDMEAEDLDRQIQDVITHVDELESKLGNFYDVVSKGNGTSKVH